MSQEQIKTISGSIYDVYTSADQRFKENRMPRVGQRCEFEDGSKYVFCSTDVDVTAGQVVAAPTDGVEITAITAATDKGTYKVSFVLASVDANQFRNGYLVVTLGTGVGYRYRIKSNTASATVDTVANTVIVTLYDPLQTALAATDNIVVKASRTSKVLVGTAALDNIGVAVAPAPAATNSTTYYFWAQTSGVAYGPSNGVASNLNLVVGAAGILEAADAVSEAVVASSLEGGATNGSAMLFFPGT